MGQFVHSDVHWWRPGLCSASSHPLVAAGRDTAAERGAGAAALSADGG